MNLTLSELYNAMNTGKESTGDVSFYGVVQEEVKEGDVTTAYLVAVGDSIVEARKLAGANVGDVVLCTTLTNGITAVTGALNGDKDAAEAKSTASSAASTATAASTTATNAYNAAVTANEAAVAAQGNAANASTAAAAAQRAAETAQSRADSVLGIAQEAQAKADAVNGIAQQAQASATAAETAAQNAVAQVGAAKAAADNAAEYASRALGNLSTVQSVAETLAWITQHGTMTLTTDTALDPSHVYFVQDANGDYVVGNTHYSIVSAPDIDDISTYYELSIDESLNNYVATHLALTNEGLWLLPDTTAANKILIATGSGSVYTVAGTYILDSSNNVLAKFGENVVLGQNDGSQLLQDYHSLQMIDQDGNQYLNISDLRNIGGYYTEIFIGDGVTQLFRLNYTPIGGVNVYVNGIFVEGEFITVSNKTVQLSDTPADGAVVRIVYKADASALDLKSFTFGNRKENTTDGALSFASGSKLTASGKCSHAEGDRTSATGSYSHAEGQNTTASGASSHAEGAGSTAGDSFAHAEGDTTTANGYASHAEGVETTATGWGSHASGYNTTAQRNWQTVIGRNNILDTYGSTNAIGKYAFIIGNGTATTSLSNALTVDWSGNTTIAGTLTQSSDKRLKEHQRYLANDAVEFIRDLKPAYFIKDGENHVGFYAQDVEEVDKWNCMVGEMNGYKTLGYTEIIAPLVAYCQQLEIRVAELEEKLK